QRTVSVAAWPTLGDHRVAGSVVVPGAAYMDWAVMAGRAALGQVAFDVTELAFSRALVVPEDDACELQLALTRDAESGTAAFEVFARRTGATDWTRHASARLVPRHADGPALDITCLGAPLSAADHYALMRRRGLAYGPAYQGVTRAACGAGTGEAEVAMPDSLAAEAGRHAFTPALLDACMQIVGPAVGAAADGTYMPVGVGRFRLLAAPGERLRCRTLVQPGAEPGTFEAAVTMDRPDGTRVAEVTGLVVQRVDTPTADPERLAFETRWEAVETGAVEAKPGRWVVLGTGAMAGELAAQLASDGADVVRVGLDELAGAIAGPGVRGVMALGAMGALSPLEAARASLEVIRAAAGLVPAVWVVTAGAKRVLDADTVPAPAEAAAWGLAGVGWTEHPDTAVTIVDLPERPDAADWAAFSRVLRAGGPETQLAIRGGQPFGRRLVAAALPRGPEFRPSADRTHLVTGGLGGIGLGLADWLIARGARHLALVGRSMPQAGAEARLAAWRAAGVDVRVFRGDVSRADDARRLLGDIGGTMPAIAGVYHAAGVLRVGPLSALSDSGLAASLAGKADGAWHLHALTRETAL
ncbi:MAG: SDR family NAD(P)-dependent oxidoreductase, partial [Candidatus Sericytochromatia bacterium]